MQYQAKGPDMTIAVLTGDIVGSTRAPDALERTMTLVAATAAQVGRWGAPTRFTRYRGDGWQMAVAEPGQALRVALLLVAGLRAAGAQETRIAIGVGAAQSMGTGSLADARGEAFERSGRALDAMPAKGRLCIDGAGLTALHPIVVEMAADRAARWTKPQAEAMLSYLQPEAPTLEAIARPLDVTTQSVGDRVQAAGGPVIRRLLRQWEDAFTVWQATGNWTT